MGHTVDGSWSPEEAAAQCAACTEPGSWRDSRCTPGAWLGRGRRQLELLPAPHSTLVVTPFFQVRKLRYLLAQRPAVSRWESVDAAHAAPAPSAGSAQPCPPSGVIAGDTQAKWPWALPGTWRYSTLCLGQPGRPVFITDPGSAVLQILGCPPKVGGSCHGGEIIEMSEGSGVRPSRVQVWLPLASGGTSPGRGRPGATTTGAAHAVGLLREEAEA